jgi:hypothetical protein
MVRGQPEGVGQTAGPARLRIVEDDAGMQMVLAQALRGAATTPRGLAMGAGSLSEEGLRCERSR